MSETPFKWYVGHSDEIYCLGPCDTREAAIAEAVADRGFQGEIDGQHVHAFHLCEATKPIVRLANYFEADDWILELEEGPLAEYSFEGPVTELGKDEVKELQDAVRSAINDWQDAKPRNIRPFMFARVRNQECLELHCDADGKLL